MVPSVDAVPCGSFAILLIGDFTRETQNDREGLFSTDQSYAGAHSHTAPAQANDGCSWRGTCVSAAVVMVQKADLVSAWPRYPAELSKLAQRCM